MLKCAPPPLSPLSPHTAVNAIRCKMARAAGKKAKAYMEEHGLSGAKMWVSPFMRARMTAQYMLKEMLPSLQKKKGAGKGEAGAAAAADGGGDGDGGGDDDAGAAVPGRGRRDSMGDVIADDDEDKLVVAVRETPLLVEQDFGSAEGTGRANLQERHPHVHSRTSTQRMYPGGTFYARMPSGESFFDVGQRVHQLFGAIHRDRHDKIWTSRKPGGRGRYKKPIDTIIVVSHGLTIRAFVQMWCRSVGR